MSSIQTIDLNSNKNQDIKVDSLPGVELLMNEKKLDKSRSNSPAPNTIKLDDLNKLESDLNDLAKPKQSLKEAQSSLFSTSKSVINNDIKVVEPKPIEPVIKLNIEEKPKESIPNSVKKVENKNETWDGYTKFNNIPIANTETTIKENLSPEDTLREKFKYLRKLEHLETKGIRLTKKYNMESSLLEMKGEYETHLSEKEKSNSIKFQGKMLMAAITGLEFLNNRFDPFDLKLDGWGEQLNENIDEYDEVFGELHEKYKSKASLAPELKLLFQLGGSAVMLHMTNTMFKSSMPGMDDIMRQNPELMQQFTQAAVNHMGEQNPQFGNFMEDVIHDQSPPPPPVKTQGPGSIKPPNRRPDIGFGRGGISMNDGIDMNDVNEQANPPMKTSRIKRTDMKGPSGITELLSGLKSKTVELPKEKNSSSTVSIKDLKEMEDETMPKRSKRKQKSDKNTVSLDI